MFCPNENTRKVPEKYPEKSVVKPNLVWWNILTVPCAVSSAFVLI